MVFGVDNANGGSSCSGSVVGRCQWGRPTPVHKAEPCRWSIRKVAERYLLAQKCLSYDTGNLGQNDCFTQQVRRGSLKNVQKAQRLLMSSESGRIIIGKRVDHASA